MVKKIPKSSCFLANNKTHHILNKQELQQYFEYLQASDDWFRDHFSSHPHPFKIFAKQKNFKELKSALGENNIPLLQISKKTEIERKDFIEKMKKNLKEIIFHFEEKRNKEKHVVKSWQQKFSKFLLLASTQTELKRAILKRMLKEHNS